MQQHREDHVAPKYSEVRSALIPPISIAKKKKSPGKVMVIKILTFGLVGACGFRFGPTQVAPFCQACLTKQNEKYNPTWQQGAACELSMYIIN